MGKKNIEKFDLMYFFLKKYVDFWHNFIYYRKVIIIGKDNIDFSVPTIFAPNHQNALMDAMAVLCTLDRQLVFLARADIFKKKMVARILYFLKILPVFRIRDGYENLKQNDDTFRDTLRVMENLNGLVILPEGNHASFRKLRQLKKGFGRIAFQTAEATGFSREINIVPVGLEFSHYWFFRQVLTVVYGHPVHVSEFYETFRENPNKGLHDLRDKLSSEMKKVMVHIEDEDNYDAVNELRNIVNDKYSDSIRYPKLFRDNRLIDKIHQLHSTNPELYREICEDSLTVRDIAAELKLTYRQLRKRKNPLGWLLMSVMLLLVTIPVFLIGAALNFLIFGISAAKTEKIKDPAFISTARYGITLGLSLILMPLYLVLSFVFIHPWWLAAIVFLSIPFTGILAWNWLLLFRRTYGGFRIRKLRLGKNHLFLRLYDTYTNLIRRISSL